MNYEKKRKWLLFGDSTVDAYGGHNLEMSDSYQGGEGWTRENPDIPWRGYFWASRIANEMNLEIDNRARSGSNINISTFYHEVSGIFILERFLKELEAGAEVPDLITLHFGANTLRDEIGSVNDAPGTDTVQAALKYFLDILREKCPKASIGVVLPYQCIWDGVSPLTDETCEHTSYGGYKALKAVMNTEKYQVPYLDLWETSGITVEDLPDMLHESSKEAQEKYYLAMRRFMEQL